MQKIQRQHFGVGKIERPQLQPNYISQLFKFTQLTPRSNYDVMRMRSSVPAGYDEVKPLFRHLIETQNIQIRIRSVFIKTDNRGYQTVVTSVPLVLITPCNRNRDRNLYYSGSILFPESVFHNIRRGRQSLRPFLFSNSSVYIYSKILNT